MKKVAISLMFILGAGIALSVANARGNPEYSIVKIEKQIQPCVQFSPALLCTFELNLFTAQTPAPCENGTTALCRPTAYSGPSAVVSGRYWCNRANENLYNEIKASYREPDIKQRDRYGNFKFVMRA